MQVTGTLYKMLEKTSSNPRFARREFVVRTRPGVRGADYLTLQMVREREGQLDAFQEGDAVLVDYDIRGRLAKSEQGDELCFTELVASRIEAAGK